MVKSNIKLLIYDLLSLIDNDSYESCEEIERGLKSGKLIKHLLEKYNMPCFTKTDMQEVIDLLKLEKGCHETTYKNGLIYLIEMLLDCA